MFYAVGVILSRGRGLKRVTSARDDGARNYGEVFCQAALFMAALIGER